MDLGSDVRRNPKISGTTHNVFGIQTGVAIAFLVRDKSRLGECNIHYASREDAEIARDKLAYLKATGLETVPFGNITPDAKSNWLNQSNSDFGRLIPLADRQTKLAKSADEERAVFRLNSLGVATNRDEWTYDFDVDVLSNKVRFFCATYQKELRRFAREKPVAIEVGNWVDRSIKWTSELEAHFAKGHALDFSSANIIPALYRPFTVKHFYYAPIIDHRRYQIPQIFPHGSGDENKTICFLGVGARRPFAALATTMTANLALFIDGTQCPPALPLHREWGAGEQHHQVGHRAHQRTLPAGMGRGVPGSGRRGRHHRRADLRLYLRRAPQPRLPARIRRGLTAGVSPPAPVPGILPMGRDGPEATGPAHRVRVSPRRIRWSATTERTLTRSGPS